jgi:hypothetical protein
MHLQHALQIERGFAKYLRRRVRDDDVQARGRRLEKSFPRIGGCIVYEVQRFVHSKKRAAREEGCSRVKRVERDGLGVPVRRSSPASGASI